MPRLYFSLLLLLQGATLGIFCALDTILFFLFWELTLAPLYFLVSLRGVGPNRRYAAVQYTLFMLAGGLPLLFGLLLLAFFFLLFGLAGMGVPGTSGFPAEFLILMSAITTHTGAGLAALFGMVLGAGYFLSLHRRAFLGPPGNEVVADAVDLRPRELILVSLLAGLILIAGIYPNLVLDLTRAATEGWMARLVSPG